MKEERFGAVLREARERRGLTQAQVAEHVGVSRPAVGQWENGDTDPSTEHFARACEFVGLPIPAAVRALIERRVDALESGAQSLDIGDTIKALETRTVKSIESDVIDYRHLAKDVKVMGVVAGGANADFYQNGEVIDYVRRPPGAMASKKVYALYVVGDSMSPRFEQGELIYVNPSRPPSIGDYVVIELHPKDGERAGAGYIKRLVKRSLGFVVCEQYNPAKSLTFKTQDIANLHRVIPWNELLGM